MYAHLHRRMTTIRCSSESNSASVVVLEQTTKSFTAFDFSSSRTSITVRLNQLIAESLMIPLALMLIVLGVFAYSVLQ